MKILLINTNDTGGGAAIAAVRLVTALNQNGIFARLAVKNKEISNPYVIELPQKKHSIFYKLIKKIISYLSMLFFPITKRLPKIIKFETSNEILHSKNYITETDINWINNSDFDLINLHWITNAIGIKEIPKITKPIIWTMHDTWPFCGAEHYPNVLENDERYKSNYTKDNKPATTKGTDLCRKVWETKKKYLSNQNIYFISPSNWECECLKDSSLFHDKKCFVIPNVIPASDYRKIENKNEIRIALGIPENKIILGFGAAYGINNPRSVKGSFYLLKALEELKNKDDYYLVIFGNANEEFTSKIAIKYFNSGFISNTKILSMLYNSCDVFICPSLVENLPNTCLESIFCGVPVVAFNAGGTKDIVVHKETGYLATPYKTNELVDGIEWCVNNQKQLSDNCIKKAVNDFNEKDVIKKYIQAYSTVLKGE